MSPTYTYSFDPHTYEHEIQRKGAEDDTLQTVFVVPCVILPASYGSNFFLRGQHPDVAENNSGCCWPGQGMA